MFGLMLCLAVAAVPVVDANGNTDYRGEAAPFVPVDSPPGWTDDTLVSLDDTKESIHPQMCIDAQDRLHVVWKDNRRLNGRDEIHYRMRDESGWSELFCVSDLDTSSNSPDVSVSADGDVHVCFQRWYGAPYAAYDLEYRRKDGVTGNWDELVRLTERESLGLSTYPKTVVAGDSVFVFWQNERAVPPEIWYVYNNGSGWSERIALAKNDARPAGYYAVHATPDGWIHAVWQDFRDGDAQLWHRVHDGDSWSTEELVTEHGYACTQPGMTTDSAGNLHLGYSGGSPGGRLHYRIWDRATRTWGAATQFYSWSGNPNPRIAVNHATGERHLAHVGNDGSWCLAYKRHDPVQQAWTDSLKLTYMGVTTGPGEMVLDGNGYVHMVFYDYRMHGNEEIFYKNNTLTSAVEEPGAGPARHRALVVPSVSAGKVRLLGDEAAEVYDAHGARVRVLEPGGNDLGRLAEGVYFIRTAEDGRRQKLVVRR